MKEGTPRREKNNSPRQSIRDTISPGILLSKHSTPMEQQRRNGANDRMKKPKLALNAWIMCPLVLVILGVILISIIVLITWHARHAMQYIFDDTHRVLLAHVQDRADLLVKAYDIVTRIATTLSSPSDMDYSTYSVIENKVAPKLFMTFATISWVSKISYIGSNGLIFTYFHEGDQVRTIFSNTTHTSNGSTAYQWYSQPANANSGEVYGNAIIMNPLQPNETIWFSGALKGMSGYASWGFEWDKSSEPMFIFNAPVAKKGMISLGILVKDFTDYISSIDLHGGYLYLATKDGHLLSETGPPHTSYVFSNDTITVHVMDQNDIIEIEEFFNVPCQTDSYTNMTTRSLISVLNIWGNRYEFSCAPLDVAGIQLVSVMSFPILYFLEKLKIVLVSLVSLMILILVVGNYIVLQLLRGLQVQETFLRANLIKQKEAIQQAERKSMNKSLAFATASHDVRTSLAGITGLIELCRGDVPPNSKLDRNLVQMNVCASKLLGILNTVLDTSKVEAGKMQLEEVEFDIAQVLEESVDIFHVVALKKGLEIIWDPCDCSVLRSSNVKGDCKRLKQIIDNLLGNAVKFTSEGHIVVRAWCKKPSLQNSNLSQKRGCDFLNLLDPMSKCFWKDEDTYNSFDALNHVQLDHNSIEFIFEIDDTGMGIPKEKRASVFENYVQVKESTLIGHEGTGLGLGIVQSFVRLMGGEINILDKEPGESGTCFKFNIFLKSNDLSSNDAEGENTDSHSIQVLNQLYVQTPFTTNAENTGEHAKVQSSFWAKAFKKGLKVEGIHSLLFVQGDETRRVVQRWMMSLGIKVWEIQHWNLLSSTLEKIKHDFNAFGRFDSASLNRTISQSTLMKECFASGIDETNHTLPLTDKDAKNTRHRGLPTSILIIIDLSYGNFSEICTVIKDFSKNLHNNIQYKVVWLVDLNTPTVDLRSNRQAPCDLILQKPFHASRLYALLQLLQDFGANDAHSCDVVIENTLQGAQQSTDPNSSENNSKPLSGLNILLVEDNSTLRFLALTKLLSLGATVESAENGLEALNLIKKALRETIPAQDRSAKKQEASESFPYNVIFMDCEMPIMNGYEATRHIRAEEKHYGHHIPIIALTAHSTSEEEKKTILSGMDFHLTKPLQTDKLLEVIHKYVKRLKTKST